MSPIGDIKPSPPRGEVDMETKKRRKRRLKPRFFTVIFSILIAILLFRFFFGRHQEVVMPNFHGWESVDVMDFVSRYDNVSVIFELVYSSTVPPTRVISQSVQPGVSLSDGDIQLIVEVSKGELIE